MAENQVPFLFNVTARGLEILTKARAEVQSLMGVLHAAEKPILIPVKVVLDDAGTVQGVRRIGKSIIDGGEAVAKNIATVHTKTLRASMRQALALKESRENLNRTIKSLYGETDREIIDAALNAAGVTTPNLVAETRLLMDMRNRVTALQNIHSAIERQLAVESGATQTPRKALGAGVKRSYSFSTGGKTIEEHTARYNRLVGPTHQIARLPGMTLDEFDDVVLAKWLEIVQPTVLRQDAIAARAALALGNIRGPAGMITDDRLQKFIRSLRPRLLELQPEEVVGAGLQDLFGGDVSKASLKIFRRKLLQQAITGEITGQELLQALTSGAGLPSESLLRTYRTIQTQEPKSLLRDIDRPVAPTPLRPLPSKVPELAPERRIKPPRGGSGGPRRILDPFEDPYNPLGLNQFQLASQERYAVLQAMASLSAASAAASVSTVTALTKYYPPGAAATRLGIPGATLRGGAFDLIGPGGVAAGGPGWMYGQPGSTALAKVPGTALVKYVPPGMALVPSPGRALVPWWSGGPGGGGPSSQPIDTPWMPWNTTGTGYTRPGPGGTGPFYAGAIGSGRPGGPYARGTPWTNTGPGVWGGGGGFGIPPTMTGPGGPGGPGGAGGGIFSKFMGRFASLAYYLAAGAILYPIIGGIYKAIENAKQLEVIVTRIHAIYGDDTLGSQLEIQQRIVDTAKKYSTDVLDTARAAQLLAQEGLKPKEFQPALEAVSRASIGLGIGQEGLTNFVIALRNATQGEYQVSPEQATNLLAAFTRRGAVSPQNLMSSVQSLLPSLQNFQSSSEDVLDNSALVMSLTSQVARRTNYTGTQVSNALRYFIGRFGNPATVSRLELLTGKQFGTAESGGQQLRSFRNIVSDIAQAYRDLINPPGGGQPQITRAQAILAEGFGVRQVGVGQNVLESWARIISDMETALKDNSSATELAAKNQDTLNAALERFSTRITDLFTAFTYAGKHVVSWLEWVIDKVSKLPIYPTSTVISERDKLLNADMGFEKGSLESYIGIGPARFARTVFGSGEPQARRAAPGFGPMWDFGLPNRQLPPDFLNPQPIPYINNLPGQAGSFGGPLLPPNMRTIEGFIGARFTGIPVMPPDEVPPTTDETAPAFDPTDFLSFWERYKKAIKRETGQDLAASLLGANRQDPTRRLRQVSSLLEGFLSSIHYDDRPEGMDLGQWIEIIDPALYEKAKSTWAELQQIIPQARQAALEKRTEIQATEYGIRRDDEIRRSTFATGRIRARVQTAFGRRGIEPSIPEELTANIQEIESGRTFALDEQGRAYENNLRLLELQYDLLQDDLTLKKEEARLRNNEEVLKIHNKHNELALEAQLNAIYKDRLTVIQDIEALAQDLNRGVKEALLKAPSLARAAGGPAIFAGGILQSFAGSLYGKAISRVDLFGREGMFPKVGQYVGELLGKPSEFTEFELPQILDPFGNIAVHANTLKIGKSPEQLAKEMKEAQIRAAAIAVGSVAGAYAGKGGLGAQVGGELGSVGGTAVGKEIGKALGGGAGNIVFPILGGIAGGILGGLFGGIFDKKEKKPPELVALEKIAANTGEQTTLLENTNRLLELQNIAFNVPTGFTLPRYGPMNTFGGGGNSINVEVNIGSTSASPQQIGAVVAQAISERLSNEYTSGGRYVARSGY